MTDGLKNIAVVVFLVGVAAASRAGVNTVSVKHIPWPAVPADQLEVPGYQSRSAPESSWALVIGGSSAHYAFDTNRLGVAARKNAYKRGYPSEVAFALDWTLRNALPPEQHPALIVWTVNRVSFVDRGDRRPHPCISENRIGRPNAEVDSRIQPCEGAVLGWEDRLTRFVEETDAWYAAREVLNDRVAQQVRSVMGYSLLNPEPDAPLHYGFSQRALRANQRAWAALGGFEAGSLLPAHVRATAVIGELANEHDIPLLVVIMPEHSETRGLYSPESRDEWRAVLETAYGRVVDLWDALPDEGFYDQAHANEIGRRLATERLATEIERHIGDQDD